MKPSEGRIIRRSLNILFSSTRRETLIGLSILIIRSLLPLVALLLIRQLVDVITGVPGTGDAAGSGLIPDQGAVTGAGSEGMINRIVPGAAGTDGMMHRTVPGAAGSIPVILMLLIGGLALALLADDLLSYAGSYVTRKQSYLLEGHISSLIHAHSSRLGLRYFEDPEFHDNLERAARDISWRPAALISDLVLLLRGVISFAAMGYLLRTFGIVPLAILVLIFIPVLLVRKGNSSRLYRIKKMVTPDRRRATYFSWLLTGEKPAREVKLFGLGEYFDTLFRKHYRESGEPELKTVKRNIVPDSLASVLKMAAFAGVMIYATMEYLRSSITAGEVAMYLVAFRQALVYLRDAAGGYSGLAENRLFLRDLFRFLDIEPDMKGDSQAPEPGSFSELAAENLTFTYPGSSQPALQDISLRVRKGEKVAIVGPNGSGKTTLVKLLCRLYDPDSGNVKVNGSDAASTDPDSYRRLFSVVFQNFMLYYLSAGENISLGGAAGGISAAGKRRAAGGEVRDEGGERFYDSGKASSDEDSGPHPQRPAVQTVEEIRQAADAAGISDLIESLPGGYDTPLGHHTEGSRELSWGEWQKIAIARAIFRKSPVLILDEPSSSLDADSEYAIFSGLGRITGGRTCIFISHRLSNVRDADRIIVLDGGRVAETGTHDELMAAGGKYYSMFMRQKSMYR